MPFFNEDDYAYRDAPHDRSNDKMSRIEKKIKLMAEVLDELLKYTNAAYWKRDEIRKKIDILKGNNDG